MTIEPKRIYLDQNVFSRMAERPDQSWSEHPMGAVLQGAQENNSGQVWLSPVHIFETVQTTDPQLRTRLANVQLDLSNGGQRIWHGAEFESIRDFFTFLQSIDCNAVRSEAFIKLRSNTARQIWQGALAMIIARPEIPYDRLSPTLKWIKLQSRLLHARLVADPERWITKMQETLDNDLGSSISEVNILPTTEADLEREIADLEKAIPGLARASRRKLLKMRDRITSLYGSYEVWQLLRAIMDLPNEASNTFDAEAIVHGWTAGAGDSFKLPLDQRIVAMSPSELNDDEATWRVIWHCIRAAAHGSLLTSKIRYETLMRELETTANQRRLPTGGLVFDVDHSAVLMFADVYVTSDSLMASSAKTIAKYISREAGGHEPMIVTKPRQLSDALRR